MNYLELVKTAGYDTPQGEYLAAKMEEKRVTAKELAYLPVVFQTETIAGIDLYKASGRLMEANKPARINATETAIQLAADSGLDLSTVTGSGKDGRIIKADVQAAIEE